MLKSLLGENATRGLPSRRIPWARLGIGRRGCVHGQGCDDNCIKKASRPRIAACLEEAFPTDHPSQTTSRSSGKYPQMRTTAPGLHLQRINTYCRNARPFGAEPSGWVQHFKDDPSWVVFDSGIFFT
jgi:hypothetical protein